MFNAWFCSHRLVARQRKRKVSPSQTPSLHHRSSPVEETHPLMMPRSGPLHQPRSCLRTVTRRKLPWTSRRRATPAKPSPCGNPFPLCCRSPRTKRARPVRPGTRAARPTSSFSRTVPAATGTTQVGKPPPHHLLIHPPTAGLFPKVVPVLPI